MLFHAVHGAVGVACRHRIDHGGGGDTSIGMVLYVLSKVSGVAFERCVIATAPFLIPLVVVLLLLTFVPWLSMWLPVLLYR